MLDLHIYLKDLTLKESRKAQVLVIQILVTLWLHSLSKESQALEQINNIGIAWS